MDGKLYENTIRNLFLERGFPVEQDPNIQGLTPDFLVSDLEKKCLIECTTLSFGQNCKKHDHLWGTNDPTQLNARLYCSLERKLQKYADDVCDGIPLVIAIFNEDCARFDTSILEAALGAWRFHSGQWVNLWAGTEDAGGLFDKYPHCLRHHPVHTFRSPLRPQSRRHQPREHRVLHLCQYRRAPNLPGWSHRIRAEVST